MDTTSNIYVWVNIICIFLHLFVLKMTRSMNAESAEKASSSDIIAIHSL